MRETKWLRWKFPKSWFQKYGKIKFWETFDEYAFSAYENALVVITGGAAFGFAPLTSTLTYGTDILIYSPLSGGLITIAAGGVVVSSGQSLYIETEHPIETANKALLAGTSKNARCHKTIPFGGRRGDSIHLRPNIIVP